MSVARRAGIGSSTSSNVWGQSASVTLERHRDSHQLSPRVPSASLWQRTNSLPCATVFGRVVCLDSCQERTVYMCLREDHSSTPAERDNQEREDRFLNLTRMEKHSNCPSFWKFECHQSSSVMLEASSTRCVDSRIKQRYFLSSILDRTCAKLCTTVKKQTLCTSLSPCGRQGIDCHFHDPTFLFNF